MIICHYTPSSSSGALLKLAQTTGLNSINESNRNLQLKDPNICTLFDVDPESALNSRKYALDMASSDNLLCTSGHMLEPKFIYLEKRGSSYFTTS